MKERQLISALISQKASAQKAFYNTWYRRMYFVACRYLSCKEDAEDALTEAFIRIFKNIGSFQYNGEGSLIKWMKTIVIHESLRIVERKKRIVYREEWGEEDILLTDDIEENIDMEYIISLVQSMPDGYRIVFSLYVIEGYCHKEIAALLGISVSTSKSQLFKARNYLMVQIHKLRMYEMGRN